MSSNIIVSNACEAADFKVCRLVRYMCFNLWWDLSLAHYGVRNRYGAYQFSSRGEDLYVPYMTGTSQMYRRCHTAHGVSIVGAGDVVA